MFAKIVALAVFVAAAHAGHLYSAPLLAAPIKVSEFRFLVVPSVNFCLVPGKSKSLGFSSAVFSFAEIV